MKFSKLYRPTVIIVTMGMLFSSSLFAAESGQCPFVIDYTLPTVSGWLNFKKITDGDGNETNEGIVTFRGFCKGQEVVKKFCFPILVEGGFAAITKEDLLKMPPMYDIGPPECASPCGLEPMAITGVRLFRNNGSVINAWVSLNFGSEDCGAVLTSKRPTSTRRHR